MRECIISKFGTEFTLSHSRSFHDGDCDSARAYHPGYRGITPRRIITFYADFNTRLRPILFSPCLRLVGVISFPLPPPVTGFQIVDSAIQYSRSNSDEFSFPLYVAHFFSLLCHTPFIRRRDFFDDRIKCLQIQVGIVRANAIIRFDLSRFRSIGERTRLSHHLPLSLAFSASSALKCVINCHHKSAFRSWTLRRVLNSSRFTCAQF